MVNVHKTEEITYTSVKTPVTRSTVETNTNPQDALYLQTKDLVLKAEDCTETAIETLEEIQSTAAEIQEDLNAKRNTILNEITLQKQAACNDISETGTTYIEFAEQKFNEIMELNLADQDLSNITTNGINVIKQALSEEIESINNTLDTKLNIADIKSYVTTTYQNGASGYRIWSDGYCEQWGNFNTDGTIVNLLKTYKDTNYIITGTIEGGNTSTLASTYGWVTSYCGGILSKTTSQFEVKGGIRATYPFNWQTCGYIT